jgi:SAM-dependent methyltransferase
MSTCPICEKSVIFYTNGRYHSEEINVTVPIYYCKKCNSFIKEIDDDIILAYFKKLDSVYTDLKYEQESYNNRIEFYNHIYTLTKKHKNLIKNWLDYGCSYGHFIDFLSGKEILSYGIEISDLRDYGNSKGLKIYKRFEDLPQKMKFDVISFIDSFYYSVTPKTLLREVFDLLYDDGLLVIRIVNRNWLVKFDKHIRKKETCTALIDHAVGYSKKSILYLLKNNGFEILETTFIEKGKYRSKRDNFLCFLATFLHMISIGLINFLPGIIIIARKNPNNIKSQKVVLD